jgi:hypothetical protein
VKRLAGILASVAAVLTLALAAPASALPPVKHVFVLWLENKDFDQTFAKDNPKAPYLARSLPAMGAMLPNYYGIGHHSLGNYIAVVSGQGPNPQTQADCPVFGEFQPGVLGADGQAMGSGCVYPSSVKTIADQLQDKGLTWKGYMEDMALGEPKECRHPAIGQQDDTQTARKTDQYAAKHNPFVYFHSIIDSRSCALNDVDLSRMSRDIAAPATTASYTFITPGLCTDGHDEPCSDGRPGGLKSIDDFLKEWVPKILASPGFKDDGLLVVSFDEADKDNSACCGEKAANTPAAGGESGGPGGGRVGAILISPFIRPGTVDPTPYNHYSFLRTTQDLFGLKHLGYAAVDGLAPIGDKTFTNPVPALTLSAKATRRDRRHVTISIDAGRKAAYSVSGVCSAAGGETGEEGRAMVTVTQSRRGSCRLTVTRPSWEPAVRSWRLRAPR